MATALRPGRTALPATERLKQRRAGGGCQAQQLTALYNERFCVKGSAMPIYAYRCSACGHAKDVLQRMSDPVLSTCPVCAAETFTKQVTAAGFQLKGSGWYATDFKGGAAAPAAEAKSEAKSEGTSGGDSASKADTQSDAKAAGKSDSKPDGKPAAAAAVTTTAPSSHGGGSCACH